MKSTQLLSVVLSLIMVFGVSAGSAFAQTDDVADGDVDRDFGEKLASWCEMTDEDKSAAAEKYGKTDEMVAKADRYCTLDESGRADFIAEHIDEFKAHMKDRMKDKVKDYLTVDDFGEKLSSWCEMTDEDKSAAAEKYGKTDEMVAKADRYCTLDESGRADFIAEHIDEFKAHMKDHMKYKVKDHLTVDDFAEKLSSWCEMTDEDKSAAAEKYGKTDEMVAKADRYCTLDESGRADFIAEHIDEFRTHMKDRMMDKAHDKPHMDYDRLCALGESERAAEIDDSEKLDRLSKWCEMSAEEREEYKKEHYDAMKDKVHDKMSDVAKDKMKMKLSDKSDRLKAMIMDKHDISDERREEIKMKYIEKHGDLTDEKKSELKMKFKDHMKNMRMEISDERKSSIHDRLAEMKAFKAELRDRASEMTDEEKQELRAEFIEKAKSMQLAWIFPRTQMTAGVDSAEVECREGFSLVMKASNGVAMCLKADTALRMIDRGLVVPAN